MKTRKSYRVVCKTDLYHASRHANFNRDGEWCENEWRNLTLKEANEKILKFFREDAEQYFANWGLAVIWSNRPRTEHQDMSACTYQDGTRAYSNDIYRWTVEEEQ